MKKILLILFLIACNAFLFGQVITTNTPGSVPRANKSIKDVEDFNLGARANLYIPRMKDTTQANESGNAPMDTCGRIIYTYLDNALWLRACSPKRWVKPGNVSTFNFLTDSSMIICYNDGHCDTIDIFNLDNTVINIVQNFTDSSVFNINDSTLLICHGVGNARVCDTIHLGNSNTYYFLNDSTLVSCDTVITTCVGDSCYQTQLCDTTLIPGQQELPVTFFQNGLRKIPGTNLVVMGDYHSDVGASQLLGDTWTWTNGYQYNIQGRALGRPVLTLQQTQWELVSSSMMQMNHLGNYTAAFPSAIDNNNPVNLYFNYITPMIPGNGVFAGDTIGFSYKDIGYAIMTNSQGDRASYLLNSNISKQTGVLLHTLDTANRDAVTIFGNQTPNSYAFSVSPFPTTTLHDSRIAVFKTTGQQQNPKYGVGTFYDTTGTFSLLVDANGNFIEGDIVPPTSVITILNDTTLLICSNNRGNVRCDTIRIINITSPTTINIFNDTTIIICNEAGSCDTITVNNYNITNGNVVNIANTVFVAKSGNDATGARQRMDLPFITIKAALAAAFPGDVIVVYPGVYEETNPLNLKKSVNYHFIGKGELRLSLSVGTGSLFTDSSTVSYSKIWAEHWKFNARDEQRVLTQSAASTVELVADSLVSEFGRTINTNGSRTIITANYMYTSGDLGGSLWITGGYFFGDIGMIQENQFGSAVWISNCPSFTLHSKKIFTQNLLHNEYLIHITDSNPLDSIYINADEIYAQLDWAIWAEGDAKEVHVTAQRISSNSDCTVTSGLLTGGLLTVTAQVIETRTAGTIDGIIHGEGGALRVIDATIKRPSGNTTGADVKVRNFGGSQGTMQLVGVVYDQTKVSENIPNQIKRTDSLVYGVNYKYTNARLETDTAQVVAANNLELGRGNVNLVSGATQITAIYTAGWQAGSASVILQFAGAPLVKNGTAGGAGTATILLAGLTDFQAAAGDNLEIYFDGTNWRETGRTVAASAGGVNIYNADGTLTDYRTLTAADKSLTFTFNSIDSSGFKITSNTTAGINEQLRLVDVILSGNSASGTPITYAGSFQNIQTASDARGLYVFGSGSGSLTESYGDGVVGKSYTGGSGVAGYSITSGAGVYGEGVTYGVHGRNNAGIAVYAQGLNSYGLYAFSSAGVPAIAELNSTVGNTVLTVLELTRNGTGGISAGIGGKILMEAETSTTTNTLAAELSWEWAVETHASRTSLIKLNGVTGAATETWLTIGQSGYVKFRPMTVTEAGAITAADGMILYLSNTDGTFTSVGFWMREAGAWVKM